MGHQENITLNDNQTVITKTTTRLELDTYTAMAKDEHFLAITPEVYSLREEADGSTFKIRMKNYSHGMKSPAILDVKLGYWLYNEGHKVQ